MTLTHEVVYGQTALERHIKWGGAEIEFYTSEYNYRSSLAWVIRKKWRDMCGIAKLERPELEHKGWNAYMRSIGYSADRLTRRVETTALNCITIWSALIN
jgi:hypothetical protein